MSEKSKQRMFILRGDSFDEGIADYEEEDRFVQVRELMRDRRFTVGETDVAYRVINHWDEVGLLPDDIKSEGGWRKFVLPELVWLRVIMRLRDFGLPLEKIAKAKERVMWRSKTDGNYPYFEFYIVRALATGADPHVCVLADGSADVATMAEIENSKILFGDLDVLLISVKAILKDMGLNSVEASRLFVLSEKETELLNEIRVQRNNEVKAKVGDDGQITEIESTRTTTQSSILEIQNQVKGQKMYGKVVTQYEDGVPKSVQVVKRQKFKK